MTLPHPSALLPSPPPLSYFQYIEDLLLSRQPLLIFLEAPFCGALHVSASGKEWLTLVCRAFHSGAVPDITMVPVGIAYDVVPDLIDEGQRVRMLAFESPEACSQK